MKWLIPAKTFLLGEYIAITGDPAIVVTTSPCFSLELELIENRDVTIKTGIHEEAPAARFWKETGDLQKTLLLQLSFYDAYQERGGLGASSAQFLAAYLASCHLSEEKPCFKALQNAYFRYAWNGGGLRPSAYDLLAQSQNRCVYISRNSIDSSTESCIQSYDWSFTDIAFILLHSGQKLATHQHLQKATMPDSASILKLKDIVRDARLALEKADSNLMVKAIESYQSILQSQLLTVASTLEKLQNLKKNNKILAAKGCGAMGSDVLLLIVEKSELKVQIDALSIQGFHVLATSESVYQGKPLIEIGT